MRNQMKLVGWLGLLALSVGSSVAQVPAVDGKLQARYAVMLADLKAEGYLLFATISYRSRPIVHKNLRNSTQCLNNFFGFRVFDSL